MSALLAESQPVSNLQALIGRRRLGHSSRAHQATRLSAVPPRGHAPGRFPPAPWPPLATAPARPPRRPAPGPVATEMPRHDCRINHLVLRSFQGRALSWGGHKSADASVACGFSISWLLLEFNLVQMARAPAAAAPPAAAAAAAPRAAAAPAGTAAVQEHTAAGAAAAAADAAGRAAAAAGGRQQMGCRALAPHSHTWSLQQFHFELSFCFNSSLNQFRWSPRRPCHENGSAAASALVLCSPLAPAGPGAELRPATAASCCCRFAFIRWISCGQHKWRRQCMLATRAP